MVPEFYEFFCPVKIISGHKALANLPYEMDLLGCRSALVVTDKGVVQAGLIKILKSAIKGANSEIKAIYDETPPDSSNTICNKVAELAREHKCDCMIAIGGGSCIDTAKGAAIDLSEGSADLLKYQGMDRLTKEMFPLIVIPTTAGTGSETTSVAVIKNDKTGLKMPFVSDKLYPALAIVDPRMTLTMPPKITAATGMDALTHSVEAFVGLQKNPLSDALAIAAVELIFDNLMVCVKNGKDKHARLAMANAAMLAGIAFSNSMVGVVHALAHSAGGICRVPHGVANAIMLPWGMEHNLAKSENELAKLAEHMRIENLGGNTHARAKAAIQAVRDLQTQLYKHAGLPLSLRDAGVTEDKLPAIAKASINDGALNYNPEDMSYKDALAILKKAF